MVSGMAEVCTIQGSNRKSWINIIMYNHILLCIMTITGGCNYIEKRMKDLSDVVDIKAAVGIGGLGMKAQVTDYYSPAIGIGIPFSGFEKYG